MVWAPGATLGCGIAADGGGRRKAQRGRKLIVLRPPHYLSMQTQRIWGFLGTLNQIVILVHAECQALIDFVSESLTSTETYSVLYYQKGVLHG